MKLPEPILTQLRESGISDASIESMRVAALSPEECQRTLDMKTLPKAGGFSLPYFDVKGNPISFERVRFVPPLADRDGKPIRYGQKAGTSTHAYLPPFVGEKRWKDSSLPLIVTEGEKKAAKAAQEGLVCLGIGGVDNWRCKSFEVAAESVEPHPTKDGMFVIHKMSKNRDIRSIKEKVVQELLDMALQGRHVLIAFDSDTTEKPRIQSAVFELDCWFYTQDCYLVEQVILPHKADGSKMGLDDFLMTHSVEAFLALPRYQPFPPNLKGWLRDELVQARKLDRNGIITCARAVSGVLLNRGAIYRDPHTGRFYYYDREFHELHQFDMSRDFLKDLNNCSLGTFIHQTYGLEASDSAVLNRAFANLAHSPTLKKVQPRKVSFAAEEAFYYQLSDSKAARVTASGIEVVNNGTDDVLFMKDQVEPIDEMVAELLTGGVALGSPKWLGTVAELTTLQPMEGLTIEETRLFLAVLCYLSPWLRKWRGLELPIEVLCGEPASGKSALYKLRRGILTGSQRLDKTPIDLRGWQVNLTHAPGMYVCDNIDKIPRDLEATFSTDLCYYVTEVDPRIEIPKLYATNVPFRAQVDCTFAFPCVKSPVHKPDLVQRTFEFRMKALPEGLGDSGWVDNKLWGYGRAAWLIDQFQVTQRFLQLAENDWRSKDTTQNRLRYFDQAVALMGAAVGQREAVAALIPKLKLAGAEALIEADPGARAIGEFCREARASGKIGEANPYRPYDLIKWRQMDVEGRFDNVHILKTVEALGRYLRDHESDLRKSCGLRRIADKRNTSLIVEEK